MGLDKSAEERLARMDAQIVKIAKDIKVLSRLSWPSECQSIFLERWHRQDPWLPEISYQGESLAGSARALEDIATALDPNDPLEAFLRATALSYMEVCRLLDCAGTQQASDISCSLYGRPGDSLSGGRVHNIDAARHFLDVSAQYHAQAALRESDFCLPASFVQQEMTRRIREVIDGHDVAVVVDANLVSKAAAGATRVRLRAGTCFSEYDLEQLLQHEVFVHSLTALNGREQRLLRCLGLGAPRTTGAQEGLATFAELVTGAIDIARMERIALRIMAVDMALDGADFIDVFRFFLETAQTELESFNSAMRVFRGMPLTGGAAFTKDTVYLHSLMEVHTFFRWALAHQRLELCRHFFSGRMTIGDTLRLEPYFCDGTLSEPRYLPTWMTRTNGLAGYLAFSVFANQIRIEELGEGHRFDELEEVGI